MKLVTVKITNDIQALQHALYQMSARVRETIEDLDNRYRDNLNDKWQGASTADLNLQREAATELENIAHTLETLQCNAETAAESAWEVNHNESSSPEHRILNRSANNTVRASQ